ncbi:hypothetical protein SNE40_006011 [Patella caerulea]|uniref:Reverse transcriptase domain-containing protein n=1 Tax=Patella caerulea TaxID=87958 RepID=A0AAN8PWX5_PATCE
MPTMMEIDTGASVSIISTQQVSIISTQQVEFLRGDGQQLQIETDNLPVLRTYSGEAMQPEGRIMLNVVHEDKAIKVPCLIVKGDGPNLLEHLNLNFINLHQVDSEDFASMFPELFEPGLGKLKNVKAKLHVDEDVKPRYFKPRLVPISMRAKVEAELDRLVNEGILKPVEFSEWGTPIVPVLKPNGDVRICGDYRLTVNTAAKVDRHPIPNIDDLYADLRGGVCFSKLDLSHAYQQVCLDDASQKLTTISTTKGLFSYTRLCYGVSSAPGIFQRIMEQVIQGIPMVIVYLGGIIVSGRTYREARVNLITVLSRLQEAGLKVNYKKCKFLQPTCEGLGHKLDKDDIQPTNEKVTATQNAPLPTSVTELKSYLGLINYYHKFMDNLSSVLAPLYKFLRNEEPWHWGKEQENAFDTSKELLQSSSVLLHYNPDLPLILSCDASPYGFGAVLSHQMKDGSDKPVAYAPRSLAPAE